ncbi:FkbM family methyltransferase [Roseivivax isoporae]|uniref:FkbM family methyltransferase n=1 Tax=Roseivivax isoporae TaxID=591206 RepID=UPI0012EC1BE0|nr:FkbM family methyltransferase [Roseivivax isoporae]
MDETHEESGACFALYIGAGNGSDVAKLCDQTVQRILLVEPQPKLSACLAAIDDDRISVLNVAVAEETGEFDFSIFNHSLQSSLKRPTGLLTLFPGLRVVERISVPTLSPVDLLDHLPHQEMRSHGNLLIVDAPGVERVLIDGLATSGALDRFNQVVLRSGKAPLFEGGAGHEELIVLLEAMGYRIFSQEVEDPAFPETYLERHPLWCEVKRLRAEAAALLEARQSAEVDAKRWMDEVHSIRHVAAEATARADYLRKELEVATTKCEADAARITGLTEEIHKRTAERDAERKRVEDAKAQQKDKDDTARAKIHKLEQDLSVLLRTQALMHSDLRELQERYRAVQLERDQQEELLHQLRPRLQEAARYLHERRLSREAPEPEVTHSGDPDSVATGKSRRIRKRRKRPL